MINPILAQIGPLTIKWYGIILGLTLIGSFLLFKKEAIKKGITKEHAIELYLYSFISFMVGCRLFYVLFYKPAYYFSHPLEIFAIWQGGIAIHGGVIVGIIFVYYYTRKKNISFTQILDLSILPIAFAMILGRIANFVNNEIVGRITTVPWGVEFTGFFGVRHPVQLYEAVSALVLFLYFYKKKDAYEKEGFTFVLFLILYLALRFITEFFKEYRVFTTGLTIGQWTSIVLIIPLSVILWKMKKNK